MKTKNRFIASAIFTMLAVLMFPITGKAQYTKLLDFSDTISGSYPNGNVIQASDGMLYGLTAHGGIYNFGVLFQYNPVTSTYTKKYDFADDVNGSSPYGGLVQASDGMLYGLTHQGGTHFVGVIFQYDPVTGVYTKKYDLDPATGGTPFGSLMQASNGLLYGMTYIGGAYNLGALFQYDPVTNICTKKVDFDGANIGSLPNCGALMQASDGMLYGMTAMGGMHDGGVIFQYNIVTDTCIKKFDFNDPVGKWPYSSLIQASDGMLYGTASYGGAYNFGALFQYNPVSSVYIKKFDFNNLTSGRHPNNTLLQSTDGQIYGTTTEAGGGGGTLFQYDIYSDTLANIMNFYYTTTGGYVRGSLIQASDGLLYGLAEQGGTNAFGTLFKFGIAAGISEKNLEIGFSIYPNPFNSQATIIFSKEQKNLTIKLVDILGKEIKTSTFSGKQFIIEKDDLKNGIYFVQVTTRDNIVISRKIIVQE